MGEKFNKNHLASLKQKKETIEAKIQEEEKRPLPDEMAIREMKAERLYLKEEISQHMQKH